MAAVTNAGGSLTSAVVLTLLAWAVRWVRSEVLRRQKENKFHKHANDRKPGVFASQLSPASLRMLVETEAYPHLVFHVHDSTSASETLPSELRGALDLPIELAPYVFGNHIAWKENFQGIPYPRSHYMLVFVGQTVQIQDQGASIAASYGFERTMTLAGALPRFSTRAVAAQPHLQFISRDAVALLVKLSGSLVVQGTRLILIDVRRTDERALYGSIKGTVNIPIDMLPSALTSNSEIFMSKYRFQKPDPEDLIIFICRTNTRSAWAAQLAEDAGFKRCMVLNQGVYGWRFDPGVKAYPGYKLGQAPPDPEAFQVEEIDVHSAAIELQSVGLGHVLSSHTVNSNSRSSSDVLFK